MPSPFTFYLAPLRGVTDHIFRNTFEKYFGSFDYLLAPFIPTVKGNIVNPSVIRDISPDYNDTRRLIPQIIGNDAQAIIVLAKTMNSLGYNTVNLNLGCPHTPVTRKKRGSGLLPYPDLIRSILEQVIPALNCAVSVKLRLGLQDEHEIDRVIPVLNDFPLSEIIIHPRTGAQMYEGIANLEAFKRCFPLCKAPVTYNGDIFTLEDFNEKCSRFPGIRRWMIGRGAISNPFLLQTLRNQKPLFNLDILKSFHDELLELNSHILSGQSHLLGKMKGYWSYLSQSFKDGTRLLKKIQKTSSLSNYKTFVEKLFSQHQPT